jgi:hypothetical protein
MSDLTGLLATSITIHFPERLPLLNGDTRRRKRRLHKKLSKLDAMQYARRVEYKSEHRKIDWA